MDRENYRNAIILYDKDTDGKDIPVGASKMGGFPDLPPEIEYPTMSAHTETWASNGKTDFYEKSAMQLVAQINLYELAESGADVENLLPKKGMLYIFWSGEIIDFESDSYVKMTVDEQDKKDIQKVIYWDGDMSTLRRTPPPLPYYRKYFDGSVEEDVFPENAVGFYDSEEYENNEEYSEDDEENSECNKIFGFPCGVNIDPVEDDEINLFQFDCWDIMGGGIYKAYWIIRRKSLEKLDFSYIILESDLD
ncbi:MAG: DUF1963 domain-containing protein [Ruminococcus sp.]|nr:DUF1963 domain-containing protein [Ruminococcus sp.]